MQVRYCGFLHKLCFVSLEFFLTFLLTNLHMSIIIVKKDKESQSQIM